MTTAQLARVVSAAAPAMKFSEAGARSIRPRESFRPYEFMSMPNSTKYRRCLEAAGVVEAGRKVGGDQLSLARRPAGKDALREGARQGLFQVSPANR